MSYNDFVFLYSLVMKIVVQNYQYQYALSRKQIEIIMSVLPKKYFEPIREFVIVHGERYSVVFEYFYHDRLVYFTYPVKEKTSEIIKDAIVELLIGLVRIKSKSQFGHKLKDKERVEYLPFVDEWLDKCLFAISKN